MSSASDERGSAALLGPHGFLGVVGAATRLYRRNIGRLLRPYLTFTLGISMLTSLAQTFLVDGGRAGVGPALVSFVSLLLFVFGASVLASTAAVVMTDDLADRTTAGWQAGARLKRVRIPLAIAAIYSAMIIGALAFLPVLGFILFLPLFLGPPILAQVIAIEGAPTPEALPRSRFLLAGHTVRVFGYLVSICLGWSLANFLVTTIVLLPGGALGEGGQRVASGVVSGVVLGLLLPWLAAAALACYLDLRVRKDDLDLATLRRERPAQP